LRTPGEIIETNFGQKPFCFDFAAYLQDEKKDFFKRIDERTKGEVNQGQLFNLVLSYLIHESYAETVQTLCKDVQIDDALSPSNRKLYPTTAFRQKTQKHILNGELDLARSEVVSVYPNFFAKHPEIGYLLECQKLIEMIASKKDDLHVNVEYGQCILLNYFSPISEGGENVLGSISAKTRGQFKSERPSAALSESQKRPLEDAFSLLAYLDPLDSPLSFLLHPSRRQIVANLLNSVLLDQEGLGGPSELEKAIVQLQIVIKEMEVAGPTPPLIFLDAEKILSGDHQSSGKSDAEDSMVLDV